MDPGIGVKLLSTIRIVSDLHLLRDSLTPQIHNRTHSGLLRQQPHERIAKLPLPKQLFRITTIQLLERSTLARTRDNTWLGCSRDKRLGESSQEGCAESSPVVLTEEKNTVPEGA